MSNQGCVASAVVVVGPILFGIPPRPGRRLEGLRKGRPRRGAAGRMTRGPTRGPTGDRPHTWATGPRGRPPGTAGGKSSPRAGSRRPSRMVHGPRWKHHRGDDDGDAVLGERFAGAASLPAKRDDHVPDPRCQDLFSRLKTIGYPLRAQASLLHAPIGEGHGDVVIRHAVEIERNDLHDDGFLLAQHHTQRSRDLRHRDVREASWGGTRTWEMPFGYHARTPEGNRPRRLSDDRRMATSSSIVSELIPPGPRVHQNQDGP